MLAIAAEQGSAKTVLSKLLRALVDPSVAPVRALPRDERELFIAASHSHVLAFVTSAGCRPGCPIPSCRLTSGGAFSIRRLFTDHGLKDARGAEGAFAGCGPECEVGHARQSFEASIPTTGARRSRKSSTPTRWPPTCASSWPTERNGREPHPTFCRPAPTGPAGQRAPVHSPAGCAGHRASSAPSELRLSSAARAGRERGQSR
jgi:hypothetical protein